MFAFSRSTSTLSAYSLLLLISGGADACSCAWDQDSPLSTADKYNASTSVFVGTMISETFPDGGDGACNYELNEGLENTFVEFSITQAWKGGAAGQSTFTVSNGAPCLSCRQFLTEGQEYLIFTEGAGDFIGFGCLGVSSGIDENSETWNTLCTLNSTACGDTSSGQRHLGQGNGNGNGNGGQPTATDSCYIVSSGGSCKKLCGANLDAAASGFNDPTSISCTASVDCAEGDGSNGGGKPKNNPKLLRKNL